MLSLGLTFCPTQKIDQFKLIKDINLFSRKLLFKVFFKNSSYSTGPPRSLNNPLWDDITIKDLKALDDLMELWEEGHTDENESSTPEINPPSPPPPPPADPTLSFFAREYKPKTRAFLALQANPNIWAFTKQVTNEIQQNRWKGLSCSNLTLGQQEAIRSLQENPNIIIKPSDKGAIWW